MIVAPCSKEKKPLNVASHRKETKVIANLTAQVEGAEPLNINIDLGSVGLYDGVTQQQSPSTTKAVSQDGYGMGYLENSHI